MLKINKVKKPVVVGEEQTNPVWKRELRKLPMCRNVVTWLFTAHSVLQIPKYRKCVSLDGGVPVWKYSIPTGKLRIPITNTLPYISSLYPFVYDYYEEIVLDKKRKPRVVELKGIEGDCLGKLVLQVVKVREDGINFTHFEISIPDVDEFCSLS